MPANLALGGIEEADALWAGPRLYIRIGSRAVKL